MLSAVEIIVFHMKLIHMRAFSKEPADMQLNSFLISNCSVRNAAKHFMFHS